MSSCNSLLTNTVLYVSFWHTQPLQNLAVKASWSLCYLHLCSPFCTSSPSSSPSVINESEVTQPSWFLATFLCALPPPSGSSYQIHSYTLLCLGISQSSSLTTFIPWVSVFLFIIFWTNRCEHVQWSNSSENSLDLSLMHKLSVQYVWCAAVQGSCNEL